jgi:hypothetical protein
MDLEFEFENFSIKEEQSIRIYTQNWCIFKIKLMNWEKLSKFKMVGKNFRVMMRRPRWESIICALKVMHTKKWRFNTCEKCTRIFDALRRSYIKIVSLCQSTKSPHSKLKVIHCVIIWVHHQAHLLRTNKFLQRCLKWCSN